MAKPPYRTAGYQRARAEMLADHPPCAHRGPRCLGSATEADHQPPLALHDHRPGSDCCTLLPSCGPCARDQGGRLGGGLVPRLVPSKVTEPAPVPLERFDVEWLEDLLDPPAEAVWPRFMTAPHPEAIGSLGMEVEAFSLERRGQPLRWWQRLASRRLLEFDRDGRLVWGTSLLTLARQLGKSYWLSDLCAWRLHAAAMLGGQQTIMSTGKDVAVCREMQRSYRVAAKHNRGTYKVREVNGQEEVELLGDGSRWLVRAKESVYGITSTFATVDEGWKVAASVVDDGIEPTTVEAANSQILLVSTAHRRATALMVGRRARALQHLFDGEGPMILEWSAPPDASLDDRSAWRMASPQWTKAREKLIGQRLEGALAGESDDVDEPDPLSSIRCQWLNQWPAKRLALTKGEHLVDPDDWLKLRGEVVDDPEKIWIAVEDHSGFGAAVAAVCLQPDGRFGVDGWLCDTWVEAMADVRRLTDGHDAAKLQVGATLTVRIPPGLRATPITSTVTRSTLPAMRELVAAGAVVHDSAELDEQIEAARVTEAIGGLGLVPGLRSDLLRAASWALAAASRPRKQPSVR